MILSDVSIYIHNVTNKQPTYGYDWYKLCFVDTTELDGAEAINAKRVYRSMYQNALLRKRTTLCNVIEMDVYRQGNNLPIHNQQADKFCVLLYFRIIHGYF